MPWMLQRLPSVPMLFALTALAGAWLCASMPVFSQEAYYWTYAQHPDLSYFDHPPMVAWLIWLGTALFGDGAFGVRLGTWLSGLGTAWFGLLLLRDFGISKFGQSLWLLVSMGCPSLVVARCLANPDPPLVCFWTLTLLALWRARSGSFRWWAVAGVAAGLALLSKYTAAFLAVGGVGMLLFDPQLRRQLKRPAPYVAVVLAAVVFLPVVIWNVRNDFESFRFQTQGRFSRGSLGAKWFLELVGGQFGMFNPVLALLLPPSIWWLLHRLRSRDPRMLLLLGFGLPLPAYLLFQSLWIQVKINWLTPAYVPILLGIVVWWQESGAEQKYPRLLKWAAMSAVLLQVLLPLAPMIRLIPPGRGSSWTGWEEIAERADAWEDKVDGEDGIEGNIFFFAADYRDAAQLGRNLKIHWGKERLVAVPPGVADGGESTLAQNVLGIDALQFDHWDSPKERIGQNAIFVLPRPEVRDGMVKQAEAHFEKVEKVERVKIERFGMHLLDADIYVCHGYRGPQVAK
jgi:hypothetical protein